MTGPEKETLSQTLELQRVVLETLSSFRREFMDDWRDFRIEIRGLVNNLDGRLSDIEHAELARLSEAAGVARFTAQQEVAKDKRSMSTARLLAMLASTATVAGMIVGAMMKLI